MGSSNTASSNGTSSHARLANGGSVEGRYTTLIVEDDRDNRELLIRLIGRCGVQTDAASTVAQAIEKLAAVPKVVLLDLHLPDGSGSDVLHFIRANQLPTAVGVITGVAEGESLAELRTFIPDRVFVKPINCHDLLTWVQAYMTNREELNPSKI